MFNEIVLNVVLSVQMLMILEKMLTNVDEK